VWASQAGITKTPYSGAVDHKLEVVDIYTEGDAFLSIALECPDCNDLRVGIQHWGEGTDRKALIAEAQRQHEISVRYDRFDGR
jgi:hypothetical protein